MCKRVGLLSTVMLGHVPGGMTSQVICLSFEKLDWGQRGDAKLKYQFHMLTESEVGEESACKAGDPSLIPGSGRSAGEGIGYRLQYSGLEHPMDCIVCGVAKHWTGLSNFHFLSY